MNPHRFFPSRCLSRLAVLCSFIVCAVGATTAQAAASAPVTAEVAAKTVRDDVFPRTQARFSDGIIGQPSITYAEIRGFRPLQLDLYTHDDFAKAPARPLVIWIHGGGWSRGDSRTSAAFSNYPAVLASLAARGYVVASLNYRLSSEAKFPAALQDVKTAIRYLRQNASAFGIDPARVLLWGGSAGGQLAALAATSCGVKALEPPVPAARASEASRAPVVSDCVQAAVIWYGIFDFASFAAKPTRVAPAVTTAYLGCWPRDCADVATQASPVSYVDRSDPPMLLIHGTADGEVPSQQSELMAARLREAGVPVQTLFIPGADHGFMAGTPEATRAAHLQALQRTFDFIDETFRRAP
jgi:acetyl esterase/lipase